MTCPSCHAPARSSWVTVFSDTECILHVVHDGSRCDLTMPTLQVVSWWASRKPLGEMPHPDGS